MRISEVRERLIAMVKQADEAMPHIRQGMGKPCGQHFTDKCSACWADAYYAGLKEAVEGIREVFVRNWETDKCAGCGLDLGAFCGYALQQNPGRWCRPCVETRFPEVGRLIAEADKYILDNGWEITFKPTADADKLRGAPDLEVGS